VTSGIARRRSVAREENTAGYQKRRREIADAAVRVFNKRGFAGASISAVAAELGMDRATLYYYVSSKEELFDEISRSVVEGNLEIVRRIHSSRLEPRKKLRELIVALMTSYAESYPLGYIFVRENLSQVGESRAGWAKHMRRINREIEGHVIAMIEQGCAEGSFRPIGSARTVAFGILGMLGWTHRWFHPSRTPESAEQIAKTYADMILGGLEAG
jgi:AcrR family transcriptional regulator